MRKIILGLAVSLDGFIEGPQGEFDWCFTDQDYGLNDFFKRVDTVFMGRKSYELVKRMEKEQGENPYAGLKTYVFSNSMNQMDDVQIVGGDIVSQVKHMQQQSGKDIWMFGGAELITAFVNANLIDEYWLSVHPILLGSGKPLFQQIRERKKLILTEHRVYETGLVSLKYAPAPEE
jgi:dihydrofolate reductase